MDRLTWSPEADNKSSISFIQWTTKGDKMGYKKLLCTWLHLLQRPLSFILPGGKVHPRLQCYCLTSQSTQFTKMTYSWTPKAKKAFNTLKEKFSSAPILIYLGPKVQFALEVDGSDRGIGARSPLVVPKRPSQMLSPISSPQKKSPQNQKPSSLSPASLGPSPGTWRTAFYVPIHHQST
ncbi:hypothetical protein CRENBAI_016667, partial [Crenichthys baileyi]